MLRFFIQWGVGFLGKNTWDKLLLPSVSSLLNKQHICCIALWERHGCQISCLSIQYLLLWIYQCCHSSSRSCGLKHMKQLQVKDLAQPSKPEVQTVTSHSHDFTDILRRAQTLKSVNTAKPVPAIEHNSLGSSSLPDSAGCLPPLSWAPT